MNLLYVLSEFPPSFGGGISTVYGRLLPRLVKNGHRVTVILASKEAVGSSYYCYQGVNVHPIQYTAWHRGLKASRAWSHHAFLFNFLPASWAAFYQAHDLSHFDIVEVTDWALLFVPWLIMYRRQPVVVSLHGSCGQVDWFSHPRNRKGEGELVRLIEAAALPLADKHIANSKLNAEFWQAQCGIEPEIVLPIRDNSVQELSAVSRTNRGLVVGRLSNWKGAEVICKALRESPNTHIDWVGSDTPWHEGPVSTATYLRGRYPDIMDNRLHFLGQCSPSEVNSRIRNASFVCIPSTWDVFNISAMDAIAAHTPVICSDKAGASMLFEDGCFGTTFSPDNPRSFVNALDYIRSSYHTLSCRHANSPQNHAHRVFNGNIVNSYTSLLLHVSDSKLRCGSTSWLRDLILRPSSRLVLGQSSLTPRHPLLRCFCSFIRLFVKN